MRESGATSVLRYERPGDRPRRQVAVRLSDEEMIVTWPVFSPGQSIVHWALLVAGVTILWVGVYVYGDMLQSQLGVAWLTPAQKRSFVVSTVPIVGVLALGAVYFTTVAVRTLCCRLRWGMVPDVLTVNGESVTLVRMERWGQRRRDWPTRDLSRIEWRYIDGGRVNPVVGARLRLCFGASRSPVVAVTTCDVHDLAAIRDRLRAELRSQRRR